MKMQKEGLVGAEYVGRGRMHVKLHEEGIMAPGGKFFMGFAQFLDAPNGAIRVQAPSLGPDERKALQAGRLNLDGDIRMTTDLVVSEHNASATPWFGGLWGAYKWHVDKNQTVGPTAVMK